MDVPADRLQHVRRSRAQLGTAVLLPALVTGALGLRGLARGGGVWRDEAASLSAAGRSVPDLLAMLHHVDAVHGLYYLLLHAWLRLGAGDDVVLARTLSVLGMLAAVGLSGAIAARLASPAVGLLAGLLLALTPSVSHYAQEARSTALVAAGGLLVTWLLVRATRSTAPGWWWAYGSVGAVLVVLNELAVLVVVAHVVTLLGWRVGRRTWRSWCAAAIAPGVAAAWMARTSRAQADQVNWIPPVSWTTVTDLVRLWAGPATVGGVLVLALVVLALLPSRDPHVRRLRALAWPLAVVPPALLVAVSVAATPLFSSRFVFTSVAGVTLLAALGLDRLARRAAASTLGRRTSWTRALVSAAVLLALGAVNAPAQHAERRPQSRPDDLAAAARIVAAGARPGDAVLFVPSNRRLAAAVDPDAFAGLRDVSLAVGPVGSATLVGRDLPLEQVEHDLEASPRVWVVGRTGLVTARSEVDATAELALLRRDFRVVQRDQAWGVGVALWVPRDGPGDPPAGTPR